ncbi:MAG TPA: hypothetical protein VMT24_16045, partial [Aggregatilineaceae bacterium]|nr:hypothetical protein [Aggregatilineaceae bacterium]
MQIALEKIFQTELNQPRRDRGLRDHAESCRSQRRAGIGELSVVECVVELRAKYECGWEISP